MKTIKFDAYDNAKLAKKVKVPNLIGQPAKHGVSIAKPMSHKPKDFCVYLDR